jgi:outer membrane protein assembly factor BamB
VAVASESDHNKRKGDAPSVAEWKQWRGPGRDAHVGWLPSSLPNEPKILWSKPCVARGLGGLAATDAVVIVSDREFNNTADAFRCLDAANGNELWSVVSPAEGNLDFGNSPRATPLIQGEFVYLAGAFGEVQCVKLASGEPVWQFDMSAEFEPPAELPWGYCASPLIVDGKLILNPGTKDASLVALDAVSGKLLWQSPGDAPGYGSFIVGAFGGRRQIVGHDKHSLGGWDPATGKRLWRVAPHHPNDFNVPTPIAVDGQLAVCTENNGTRLFRFRDDGTIVPDPVATNEDVAPDTHTPVVVGNRLFGISSALYCLDLKNGLKPLWQSDDDAFGVHAAVIASPDRILALTLDGELLLIDAKSDGCRFLGRTKIFTDDNGVYSHPALVGNRLYVRGTSQLVCIELPRK